MEINIQNYEEYAIDFLEGNLSVEGEEAMQFFLLQHPAIEAEILGLEEDLEAVTLEEETRLVFADKELLFQLEEEKKVVPLYVAGRNWRKYVLPIAAVLCVFLVWQAFFQSIGEVSEGRSDFMVGQKKIEKLNDVKLEEIDTVTVKSLAIGGQKNGSVKNKSSLKNKVKSPSSNLNQENKAEEVSRNRQQIAKQTEKINSIVLPEDKSLVLNRGKNEIQKLIPKPNVLEWGENQVKREEVVALKVETKKTVKSEISDKRRREVVLTALPTQSNEIIAQNIAMELDWKGLEQSSLPPISPKKQSSNFMKNLKKVLLPEVWVKNTDEEVEESGGSDILVSISVTPEQHSFIKKIFKNNK